MEKDIKRPSVRKLEFTRDFVILGTNSSVNPTVGSRKYNTSNKSIRIFWLPLVAGLINTLEKVYMNGDPSVLSGGLEIDLDEENTEIRFVSHSSFFKTFDLIFSIIILM